MVDLVTGAASVQSGAERPDAAYAAASAVRNSSRCASRTRVTQQQEIVTLVKQGKKDRRRRGALGVHPATVSRLLRRT